MAHDDLGVEAAYTQDFLTALEHGGSWAREARLAVALAAQLCRSLNEDALVFADVRDVQTVNIYLQHLIEKKRRRVHARFPHSAILRIEGSRSGVGRKADEQQRAGCRGDALPGMWRRVRRDDSH